MAKIAFIGAGSTVFARNLLRDLFTFPELHVDDRADGHRPGAAARRPRRVAHRVADQRRRAADDRGDHRPAAGARRRRLRHQHDPGRRLPAGDGDRLRDPEAVRPAPDDRRHARHRRHHARAAHDPGDARYGAATWRSSARTRSSSTTPTRWRCSDLGDQPGDADQDGRALPQRAGHGRRARRAGSACRSTRSTTVCAGINHMAFYLRFERERRETSIPPCGRSRPSGREPACDRVRFELFSASATS